MTLPRHSAAWMRGLRAAWAVALVLLAAPSAGAQERDLGVVGIGVSTLRSDGQTALGVAVDIARGFAVGRTAWIGPAADVAIHRSDDITVSSFMGGGRLTFGGTAAQGFGQFLVGIERCCGISDLAWQPGGGVDVRVTDRLSLRGQLDIRIVQVESDDLVFRSREWRWTFGMSLPF